MRKLIMMIMVALSALPTVAQDWQSTSTMQGSGSAYSAQVTAVGAAEVSDMATSTDDSHSTANAPSRRRSHEGNTGFGEWEEGSPIGDAVLPLFLLSCAYLGFRLLRTRKRA